MAAKAIRSGDWKLISEGNEHHRWALFNLAEDVGESKDLAQKAPKKVQQLKSAWEEWNATLPPYRSAS
jgi:arylsulfatase A-like enzyme